LVYRESCKPAEPVCLEFCGLFLGEVQFALQIA
jgi:hypothetical protein